MISLILLLQLFCSKLFSSQTVLICTDKMSVYMSNLHFIVHGVRVPLSSVRLVIVRSISYACLLYYFHHARARATAVRAFCSSVLLFIVHVCRILPDWIVSSLFRISITYTTRPGKIDLDRVEMVDSEVHALGQKLYVDEMTPSGGWRHSNVPALQLRR